MKTLFESFIDMADHLPPRAVKEALDRESRMIEGDLIHDRILSWMDGFSIMVFHRFVEAVKNHDKLMAVVLPPEHVAAYRELVKKLGGPVSCLITRSRTLMMRFGAAVRARKMRRHKPVAHQQDAL
jgi:hypothetical protein